MRPSASTPRRSGFRSSSAGRIARRCGSWPASGRGSASGDRRSGSRAARGGVHVHYAMHLEPEDYDAAVARLREHGHEPHEEQFDAYGDSRAAYVDDPDGNVVELWTWDVANHLRA